MSIFVTVDTGGMVTGTITVSNDSGMTVDELFPNSPDYTATLIGADAYPDVAVGWKGTKSGNGWTFAAPSNLAVTQLAAISAATDARTQACFARQAVLVAAVAAGTYTDAMLTEGWPS